MSRPRGVSRRAFLAAAAGAGGLLPAGLAGAGGGEVKVPSRGVVAAVSSGNGLRATARAVELVRQGADTLDAAVAGVNIVEEDPEDASVGYGGLPNEEGVVELDACVMHGPTWSCGAVAALQKIKTPSSVARLVMTRTDHVLLVGEGALRFALAHGFEPVNLLTEKARKEWLRWKESRSPIDDWIEPREAEAKMRSRPTGTITCLVLDAKGDLSGVTSTSGLAFKLPGRVGDSPIIGAGLYVDNDAGAAGATGRGEAVITAGGSRIVVENMRRGMSAAEAVRDVLERIARQTLDPRLRDKEGRPSFDVSLYALKRNGEVASGSLWSGKRFAAHDGETNALRDCFHLFARSGKEGG
ncbi:MAG: N(4)-(beta-N-acetylglucosaminyl)-L-asparaginase [Planctomycetes bacterium]|nr:N(4)-(beta-N-acetylglucosaminyl)-L-asparaginase [Planctomycetota bacterium]